MAESKVLDIGKELEVTLPPTEDMYVEKNPEGLTKEGVEFNLKSWKYESSNRYVVRRYKEMLKRCKTLQSSGKLDDGSTILSRNNDGKVTWAQKID